MTHAPCPNTSIDTAAPVAAFTAAATLGGVALRGNVNALARRYRR